MEPKVLSDEEAGEMFSDIDALAERERLHRAQMTEEDAFLTEAMGPKSDKVDREAEQLKRFNETKIEDVEADAGRILQALGIPLFGGLEQPVEVPRHPASQRASSDAGAAARTAAAEMKGLASTWERTGTSKKDVESLTRLAEAYPAEHAYITPEGRRYFAESRRAKASGNWSKWRQLEDLRDREIRKAIDQASDAYIVWLHKLQGQRFGKHATEALDKMRDFLNKQAAAKELWKLPAQSAKYINPVMGVASALTGAFYAPATFFKEFAESQEFEPQLRFMAHVGFKRPLRPGDLDPNAISALRDNPGKAESLFSDGTLSSELMDVIESPGDAETESESPEDVYTGPVGRQEA